MKGKQKKIKSKNGKSHNVENFKEDLNKAAKALQKSKNFLPWLDNAQLWIDENFTRLSNIFTAFADDWKEIPFEHFKAGMKDAGAPCSDVELHYLCLLLDDRKTNSVQLERLRSVLKAVRTSVEKMRQRNEPGIALPVHEKKCPHGCSMPYWDGLGVGEGFAVRYVEIEFRFLPFRHFDKHPGHVRALVEIGSTMAQLGNLDYPMSALPDHSSLEDVGVIGGTKFHPAKQKMFYDYEIEDDFCPILLCDHYFCDMFHV